MVSPEINGATPEDVHVTSELKESPLPSAVNLDENPTASIGIVEAEQTPAETVELPNGKDARSLDEVLRGVGRRGTVDESSVKQNQVANGVDGGEPPSLAAAGALSEAAPCTAEEAPVLPSTAPLEDGLLSVAADGASAVKAPSIGELLAGAAAKDGGVSASATDLAPSGPGGQKSDLGLESQPVSGDGSEAKPAVQEGAEAIEGAVDPPAAEVQSEAAGGADGAKVAAAPVAAEHELVELPAHWLAKPCLRITGLRGRGAAGGGPLPEEEEELRLLLEGVAKLVSLNFEDRGDVAFARLDAPVEKSADLALELKTTAVERKMFQRGEESAASAISFGRGHVDWLLFVGNLRKDIDDAELQRMFEPHGKIERAFVMTRADGSSKGYGFVEFSLKAQANAAKAKMGNLDMDGRVLRVEWAEVPKAADLFSPVLFVDRVPKEGSGISEKLRALFEEHGTVRDCRLVTGNYGQPRGFAFVDFAHSLHADKGEKGEKGQRGERPRDGRLWKGSAMGRADQKGRKGKGRMYGG
eukprot:TRINITY_DN217_c0_g4_i2.p1 TRINITY_DN217_c0_g4~~TRINITY_DN217_c0_g4_i2.p1  ORF type:complete len:528 (-),score=144.24 TRINITY_DN217_c0_g4_i2:1420-3003(-)